MTLTQKKIEALIAAAIAAQKNAYAPYSQHPVGAALITARGKIFSGCNCEFANFDVNCAENSAIVAMIAAGEREIAAIAVVGPNPKALCTPCGRCRQRLYEFSTPETRVYSAFNTGQIGAAHSIDDLLPLAFGPKNLKKVK
jgi:cytidine deaminase